MLSYASYRAKKTGGAQDMGVLYRVRKRPNVDDDGSAFVVRTAPSGGKVVTINNSVHKKAKLAAYKRLRLREKFTTRK